MRRVYLLAFASLAHAVRQAVENLATLEGAEKLESSVDGNSTEFDTSAANLSAPFEGLFVFVRKVPIRVPYVGGIFGGFHTEIVFCTSDQDLDSVTELLSTNSIDDVANEPGRGWFGQTFSHCYTNGFPGVHFLFEDNLQEPPKLDFFAEPHAEGITTHFIGSTDKIGKTVRDIRAFTTNMQKCGNWETSDYDLLGNNCNSYQDAVMRALFPEVDGRGRIRKHRFFGRHKLEADIIIDNGWWDPARGSCVGAKCYTPCYNPEPGRAMNVFGTCVQGNCYRNKRVLGQGCTHLTREGEHEDLFRMCAKEAGICHDRSRFQQSGDFYGCHLY